MAKLKKQKHPALRISADVAREIRQHARSNSKTEVCGVLVGRESDGVTTVDACISGVNATQGGTHVTFTQDTWEHIYKIKDRDFPDERIVGWYHSHPGFGVFLSDHDTFIHKNFFSSLQQVAWVYDPHSDEEGCFGWCGESLERLAQFAVVDSKGGELAGATGKPEPSLVGDDSPGESWEAEDRDAEAKKDEEISRLTNIVTTVFSYLAVLILGGALVWYFLPHILVMPVPVDPNTGQPLHSYQDAPSVGPGPKTTPQGQAGNDPGAAPSEKTKPDSRGSEGSHERR